ncbi:hypothetical protein NQ315_002536 [Exocentrus adspersus]|uniref:NR LBD domain-containing protein n=1 Tax=Exocentrus adspersus TaxID=1586481 RepID=A0AAV8VET2_9CUCU|nr:hypothetical protein NQ315_002536 [Exocentrus adspersus]
MNKDAVQHERGPRNSTLRRQQMSHTRLFGESSDRIMVSPPGSILNLTLPKGTLSQTMENPFSIIPPPGLLCNPLLAMQRLPVPLPSVLPPAAPNPASICESAARLLFMNVQWVKGLPSFTLLPMPDQLLLLEESWRELFVLGYAQFLPLTELRAFVHASGILKNEENNSVLLQNVQEFQDVLTSIRQFQLDMHEYASLRSIILFKTSFDKPSSSSSPNSTESKVLVDPLKVSRAQDDMQLMLNKYISSAHPGQPLRFGKLLLLLPTFRNVSGETIEELFFRKTIGHIPIVRIICDMYKTEAPGII